MGWKMFAELVEERGQRWPSEMVSGDRKNLVVQTSVESLAFYPLFLRVASTKWLACLRAGDETGDSGSRSASSYLATVGWTGGREGVMGWGVYRVECTNLQLSLTSCREYWLLYSPA